MRSPTGRTDFWLLRVHRRAQACVRVLLSFGEVVAEGFDFGLESSQCSLSERQALGCTRLPGGVLDLSPGRQVIAMQVGVPVAVRAMPSVILRF